MSDPIYHFSWLYLGGSPPVPSACGTEALPRNGDVNYDGDIDHSDVVHLVRGLFQGGRPPVELELRRGGSRRGRSGRASPAVGLPERPPFRVADRCQVAGISSGPYLLASQFLGTAPPPAPLAACGGDPTTDHREFLRSPPASRAEDAIEESV